MESSLKKVKVKRKHEGRIIAPYGHNCVTLENPSFKNLESIENKGS
jgi:hypothetical protein